MSSERVVALPGCSAASAVWRHRGRLYLTVITKAVFVADAAGVLRRAEPEPIATEDVPLHGHPLSSVRIPRESGPPLARAEVVLNGHACAPSGPVSRLTCRLRMCAGERVLIDKSVIVESSSPFVRMPIVYERAFGGIGAAENPVGTGAREGDRPPNILDPNDPRRPAGFQAIGSSWRSRRALLGSLRRDALQGAVLDLPDDFSWDFFQAAPVDQRVDFFQGGETIELHGLSARFSCLTVRLPRVRGLARISGGAGHDETIALKADLLRIEADEERYVFVCRGNAVLPDGNALRSMEILAGVEADGEPLRWPEPRPAARGLGATVLLAAGDSPESSAGPATLQLEEGDIELVEEPSGQREPGDGVEALAGPATVPVRPAVRAPLDSTMISEATPSQRPAALPRPTLPFRAGASPSLLLASQPRPRPRKITDTVEIAPDEPISDRMPFHSPEARRPSVPPPAAPAAPPPVPGPPAPSHVYAGDRVEAAPAPAPPPAKKTSGRVLSPPGPSAEIRRGLYGRFGK